MPFYGYEFRIKKAIEKHGHQVDFLYDIEKLSFVKRIVKKITGERRKFDLEYQMPLLDTISSDYDVVLVIVGRCLQPEFLDGIRGKNLNAKFVLYLWDDVLRVANFKEVCNKYDKIYSFDNLDCEKYGFEFLPLFYCEDCKISDCKKEYDIYSSLWNHSDRLKIVKQITTRYPDYQYNFYIYFFSKRHYIKAKIAQIYSNDSLMPFYHSERMSYIDNISNMSKSKSLLDIQHPTQTGLTMRTIETIGCGVKLITTNTEVKKYDFYNSNNIWVINRENPEIPKSFLETPYESLPNEIYSKYSIGEWVKKILNS